MGFGEKTSLSLDSPFKPNTDDLRESPSIALITALQDMGAHVRAFDPAAMDQAKLVMPKLTYCESAYHCAEGADALVIVTEWEQFRALDLARLRSVMASPVIVDLRNVYHPEEMRRHGFAYACVGRANNLTVETEARSVAAVPSNPKATSKATGS